MLLVALALLVVACLAVDVYLLIASRLSAPQLVLVLQPSHTAHTLDAIANRFGVENHDRHSALGDSMTTAEIFVEIIDVLAVRGIHKLGEALEASDRIQAIKRLQEKF